MDSSQNSSPGQLLLYLDKEMSSDEQLAFEKELLSNEQLRSAFDSLQQARGAVILYGIKEQVSRIHKEAWIINSKQAPVIKMPAYRKFAKYAVVAAACIILIFIAVDRYNYSKISADSLYAEQFTRYEPVASRGSIETISATEKAYTTKNYNEVISIYRSTAFPDPKQMIMAGVAYLETSQALRAVEVFQSLLATNKLNNTTFFNDEASYYLALAYLKNRTYLPAVELMEKIHADKGNAYSQKFSDEYIDRVKKISSR